MPTACFTFLPERQDFENGNSPHNMPSLDCQHAACAHLGALHARKDQNGNCGRALSTPNARAPTALSHPCSLRVPRGGTASEAPYHKLHDLQDLCLMSTLRLPTFNRSSPAFLRSSRAEIHSGTLLRPCRIITLLRGMRGSSGMLADAEGALWLFPLQQHCV